MANPAGEPVDGPLRFDFDRLGGYEDVNDADRPGRDPAMRWIDRVHARHPPRAIVLDTDSMAIRKAPPGMDPSPAPAAIRCLCSTGSAIRNAAQGDQYTILRQSIACLPTRPVGRPPDHMIRTHAGFSHQAGSWDKKRRVVARVERHPGERVPRVGFIVTRLSRPTGRVVAFCNRRGAAGQHIEEGRNAIVRTRLFRNNAVRLRLHALACNPGNFMRTPALPEAVRRWSPTGVKEKPIRIVAGIVTHGRYVTFRLAGRLPRARVPGGLFAEILRLIAGLRPQPAPA